MRPGTPERRTRRLNVQAATKVATNACQRGGGPSRFRQLDGTSVEAIATKSRQAKTSYGIPVDSN